MFSVNVDKLTWTQLDYFYYFINKLLTYIIICDINILKEFFCGQHMYFNYKYISI